MNKLIYIGVLSLAILSPGQLIAAENPDQATVIQASEKKSVFKGLLYKVWGKFKAMSPKKENQKVRNITVTAGIRGSETTTSILKPYWKDDKTSDKQFIQQLEDFAQAQTLIEDGNLQQANQAFNGFIQSWPDSDLRPNAQFGLGLTYGGMGQNAQSVQAFEAFISAHPQHPLVADAREIIAEMK